MRILTSVLGLLGALTAAYLGLYVGVIAGESVMVAPGDTLLLAAPLLAAAGVAAVWLKPALARAAFWSALVAWLAFGVTIAALGADGLEVRHVLAIGAIIILPAGLLAAAAVTAGKLCSQQKTAAPR